jgi:hypothetical protein
VQAHHTSALGELSHRRAGRRVGGSASRLINTSAGNREQVREFRREQLREFDGGGSCRHRAGRCGQERESLDAPGAPHPLMFTIICS